MKNIKITGIIGFLLQLIFSITAVVCIIKTDILRSVYIFFVVLILLLLLIISAVLVISRSRPLVAVGMVFSLLMSVVLAVLSFKYVNPFNRGIDKVTTPGSTYIVKYHVVVKLDDSAEKIEDIANDKIGVENNHDFDAIKKAMDGLAARLSHTINIVAYDSYDDMWNAFMNSDETRAILMDTNFFGMRRDFYADNGDNIDNYVRILDDIDVEINIETDPGQDSGQTGATPNGPLTERPFVLYISGIDVSGSINQKSRSDVNIVMAVNPNTHKILLVTIPRDAYVQFPGVTGDAYDKLTHAGIYGNNDCSVSIATLEQNVYKGIHIDHWIRVNFTSLEKIVDALGGIEAYSKYSYTSYFTGEPVYFSEGMNYMDGWKALVFCRERKSIPGEEPQRGRNQLEVIKGIFNKATSPSIILSYNDVLDQITQNVVTDMSRDDITNLIKRQIDERASWSFETASVEVEYVYDYCYSYGSHKLCVGLIDEESRQDAVNKINAVLNGN